MKLKNCKSCGKEIAKNARVCPHCGHKYSRISGCFAFVIIFIIVSFMIGYVISNLSKKDNVETYPVNRTATGDLPAYTILFVNDALDGSGRFGDVLVPTLSRQTPESERESIVRKIAKKENINVLLYLFSTEEAFQANMSSSYAKAHPNALREGYLGVLDGGEWTPGEDIHP